MTRIPLNKLKNYALLQMKRGETVKGNVIKIPGSQQPQRCEQSSGNHIAASKASEQAAGTIARMMTQFLLEVYIQFMAYTLHTPCSATGKSKLGHVFPF